MVYAGFWRRFAALILDAIFVWVICMLLIIPWFITPLCIIIGGVYRVVFETSPLRATPGKALMKMAVVKTNGSALTVQDSIIRMAVSFLSSALLCAGYLMALFTEKKQTLHDFVSDTVVINETFAENNFWQIFVAQSKVIFGRGSHPLSENEAPKATHQSLEELYNLHQKGILTDDEYRMKKEEYLRRL